MYRVTITGRIGFSELILGGLTEAQAQRVFGSGWSLPGDVVKLERGEIEVAQRTLKVIERV